MSYILEALKKAQAERQLGSTPTIHASQLHLGDAAGGRSSRLPLMLSLAVAVLALGAAAAFYLQPAPVAAEPSPVPPPARERAATLPAAPAPAVLPQSAPPQKSASTSDPFAAAMRGVREQPAATPAPARKEEPGAPAASPAAAAPLNAAEPAQAGQVPLLRELPNGGSGIPKVELGGYIYSENPADRLIVINKDLRKEGDEVAPGLLLEKLGPTAAVLNYRGTRFRVPY